MVAISGSEDHQQEVVTKRDEQERRVRNAEQQWTESAHLDQVQEHLPEEGVHVGCYAGKGPCCCTPIGLGGNASIAQSGKKYRQPVGSKRPSTGLAFDLRR